MYEVIDGYWNYGSHTFAVTDDLMYARTLLLQRVDKACRSRMTPDTFACFERLFEEFQRDTSRSLYFSIGDYHFSMRQSQIKVAVGGMATL